MIYRFKSKAGADVIMLQPQGEQILRLLSRETAGPGLLRGAQLPEASAALERAVAEDEAAFAQLQAEASAAGEPPPRREGISLRQRVWPLLELIGHAQRAEADVVWGV
ncbi:DUF1840 domain-containing protein [Paucibacter sp. DJ1R-11]|uniref:DUF1840 domain-containing protein n=1 Tax=Paucibacter sp. DJ1R-11 TaxID=2893556 RepID=UPI0021E3E6C3|nr:DUF1840 domain-containing protein [Paucibacter sp. DJ1R-11]MCV2362079.1 DUF1840 domain-containing protein [Paucibacter sp. DJ1R-11]